MSNPILKIFNKKYIISLFEKEVLPLYPNFVKIKKVEIKPQKKLVWETTYHVVVWFKTDFVDKNKKTKTIDIYCSAHSGEDRKNVYDALEFLWGKNFGRGYLTIPHPLFYSQELRGTFYRGVKGRTLLYYIKKKNRKTIEKFVKKISLWFAKLHKIKGGKNFNEKNSLIRTVVPGKDYALEKIASHYPEMKDVCAEIYEILIKREEDFLNSTSERWLVHGDAHPENFIKMGENKIAGIDFSDFCLADFARDLGSFMQQIEYKCEKKMGDALFGEKMKKTFLENYLLNAKIKIDSSLEERIKTYYNWTAFRTAIFFLTKDSPNPERAADLIEKIKKNLAFKE